MFILISESNDPSIEYENVYKVLIQYKHTLIFI